MGVNNTATLGGAQIGNVGGGNSTPDVSEGKQQNVTGGTATQLSNSNADQISFGNVDTGATSTNNITFQQESPQAIAALGQIASAAIQESAFTVGAQGAALSKALDAANAASAPTSKSFLMLATLGVAAFGLYLYFRGGK